MDPFFSDASVSKLIETGQSVLLTLVLVGMAIAVSERAFGLNIRKVIDAAESLMEQADKSGGGNPWPAVALLLGGLIAIVVLVR